MIIDLLPCLVLVLIAGVPTVLLVIVITRRRSKHIGEPVCGKCGYAVRGLPTFTCPECGSDLRAVGIVTEGHSSISPTMRGWLLVLVWTLVLPIPAFLLTVLIVQAAPQLNSTTARQVLDKPASNAYQRIELVQNRVERDNVVISNDLTIALVAAQGDPLRLEVSPRALSYSYRCKSGEKVQADSGLDAEVILDWMAQASVDVTNEQVKSEAVELAAMVQAASGSLVTDLPHEKFSSGSTSSFSDFGPPNWVGVTVAGFWLVLWLLGCWKFWKIGTRKPA